MASFTQKIRHNPDEGEGLADDGSQGGSFHAPIESVNEYRIEDDVGAGS
ncbi:hypothetical protein SDC9_154780 [bioreactor metagenome]|uniref:Uncharacterized protein n=1 Tax=bioreactor metagenome TaxID=1076179 RepID=A0A645F177_9ZZZZ